MTTILINFRAEFAPLIECGVMPHTIRPKRRDGHDPLPGDTLLLYTGSNSKAARLLRREPCQYTTEITIQPSAGNVHHVLMGGKPLEQHDIEVLATVDGFQDGTAFVRFFEKMYGLPFTGVLIGWEPMPMYATRH